MQVQINTMPNVNFKAQFTKSAQTFVDKGFKQLCSSTGYSIKESIRVEKLANEIVNDMKNTNPLGGHAIMDMNESGNRLVCKIYSQKGDIQELKETISSINIHENPFLDVLRDFRYKLIPIKEEPCKRPDSDFTDKYGNDVRKSEISTHYTRPDFSMCSYFDENDKYHIMWTWGKY